jgi:thiol-disulfide isomerase/thioredoxin
LAAAGEPSGVAQPGTPLPDGELLDVTGQPATLAQALSGNPAVLVFYRGGWCPYCNIALRTYQAQLVPALAERCKWRQAAALGRGGAGIGEGRGLKPGAEDLALFAEAAAGWLSIDSRGSGSRPATAGEPCGGREQQHLA